MKLNQLDKEKILQKDFYTAREVTRLGVIKSPKGLNSYDYILELLKSQTLRATRPGKKNASYRIYAEAIIDFLEQY